ncbi:adenosylcobinamide-GDP ribazoletransferase [Jannaschia rubra]|uniref:Adenosylcobinamide-GDP ribazoletransferase n=1 Tax=Jannaschia rubra TaxID=282197 RepID=A0A0M6XRP1_9RHOB|nr:adenosylcobinamide-GDP ribazoletransferase [Jannaschia rubra]CTQ33799.1 Cobalamin synthase [Jannaschia rubra]SFG09361.1 cobalamin-5'-phosphate synthase [Jannaschia rubra]
MSPTSDLVSAAMLLTRLPVRGRPTDPAARAAWAWPVVGGLIGAIAAGVGTALGAMGAEPPVVAAVVLLSLILLTGALHEDGLADAADGLWGGGTRDRRLEIMRDSRIGTYGVIALVLSLLLRWALIAIALQQGQMVEVVLAAAIVSRAPMAIAMRWLPAARDDGVSRGAGRPPAWAAQAGLLLAGLVLLFFGGHGLVAAMLVAGVLLGVGHLARSRIGGQTGDVLGTIQQLSEIAVLVALTSR